MFHKKTIKDVKLDNKTVLVSVDYNVPGDEHGDVTDNYRIHGSLPTLEYLLTKKCKVILISHRNRPEGKFVAKDSLKPVAKELSKIIKKPVEFCADCVGSEAAVAKNNLKSGQILLLENTRFHSEEEKNDKKFAKELADGADYFVQEAFGNAHRKHASTDAITEFLPSVAGLLIEKEVSSITEVMQNPKRPLMAIVGGAKIADKLEVIHNFIETADVVAIGGAMANTFLLAKKIPIGKSMAEPHSVELARDIIHRAEAESKKRPFIFYLPQDGVVATKIDKTAKTRTVDWDAHVVAELKNYPKRPAKEASEVGKDEMILDIGPFSAAFICGAMQVCNMVIWNGPVGMTETPAVDGPIGPFAHGTHTLIESMLGQFGHKPQTLVGGGDTAGYVQKLGLTKYFNHVSTGGGAGLQLMAGKKLPAVEALQSKK